MENGDNALQGKVYGSEEINNLMYEIESAGRQISSLQTLLSGKNKEVASLQAQLIEREVLLKRAAVCIEEAINLCRQQTAHTKETHKFLKVYEEDWEILERRMRKVQEELPEILVSDILTGQGEGGVDKFRGRVESTVKEGEERIKRLFGE